MKTVSTYLFAFSILFSLIVSCDQRKSATGINGESGFSNFIDSIGIENIWENEEFLIFDNSLDSLVDNLENEYARSKDR